jgi:hypothetical protein
MNICPENPHLVSMTNISYWLVWGRAWVSYIKVRRLTAWTMVRSEYRAGAVVKGYRILCFMAGRRGIVCSTMQRDPSCLSWYLIGTPLPPPGERNHTFPLHYAWSWIIWYFRFTPLYWREVTREMTPGDVITRTMLMCFVKMQEFLNFIHDAYQERFILGIDHKWRTQFCRKTDLHPPPVKFRQDSLTPLS